VDAGDYHFVELPYGRKELSMVIVLPKEIDGLAGLGKRLTSVEFDHWYSRVQETRMNFDMPRFKFTTSLQLRKSLISLGMRTVFAGATADLSGMSEEHLSVSEVIHQTFIEVDEKGTEAAAATAVVTRGYASVVATPDPISIHVDRPFMFVIRDNRTGVILFLGRVSEPEV
jgi:serpin B